MKAVLDVNECLIGTLFVDLLKYQKSFTFHGSQIGNITLRVAAMSAAFSSDCMR